MTPLQATAYAQPWANSSHMEPAVDKLPSGEVIGLSINK
jgi:hypothetical protein